MAVSPFSSIDADFLLMIFNILTQASYNFERKRFSRGPAKTRPIDDIRTVSQVCRRWRETTLDSPGLWGRLIDLGGVRRSRKGSGGEYHRPQYLEWMEVVLERAGSAPLWIYGRVETRRSDFLSESDYLSFFIQLLESWERIEKMSIVIGGDDIPHAIQARFLSPAPILKYFEVETPNLFSGEDLFLHTIQQGSSQRLFADYAPLLRTMKVGRIAFRLDSSWLRGIREMAPIPLWATTQDIFTLLQMAPLLKNVEIHRTYPDETSVLPTLHLPNLTSISLKTGLSDGARILENIIPGKLSMLSIEISDHWPSTFNASIIPSFKKSLPSYVFNYFTSTASTHVSLKFIEGGFAFFSDSSTKNEHRSLNVELEDPEVSSHQDNTDEFILCVLDAIIEASSLGEKAAQMNLFNSINQITLCFSDVQFMMFEHLHSVLLVFRRVQILRTDEDSAQDLFSVCFPSEYVSDDAEYRDGHDFLFPELHTLYLNSTSITEHDITLADFLLERKKMGYPVATFDMTICSPCYIPDMRELEKVEGLEVLWQKEVCNTESGEDEFQIWSYTCGSGGADMSNIKRVY